MCGLSNLAQPIAKPLLPRLPKPPPVPKAKALWSYTATNGDELSFNEVRTAPISATAHVSAGGDDYHHAEIHGRLVRGRAEWQEGHVPIQLRHGSRTARGGRGGGVPVRADRFFSDEAGPSLRATHRPGCHSLSLFPVTAICMRTEHSLPSRCTTPSLHLRP